jgi:hypothetical protein
MWEISRLAEKLLASQEVLRSMEFVRSFVSYLAGWFVGYLFGWLVGWLVG